MDFSRVVEYETKFVPDAPFNEQRIGHPYGRRRGSCSRVHSRGKPASLGTSIPKEDIAAGGMSAFPHLRGTRFLTASARFGRRGERTCVRRSPSSACRK